MTVRPHIVLLLALVAGLTPWVAVAGEGGTGLTLCTMTFDFKGWSIFFATGSGAGTITCDNGQTADVKLSSKRIRIQLFCDALSPLTPSIAFLAATRGPRVRAWR